MMKDTITYESFLIPFFITFLAHSTGAYWHSQYSADSGWWEGLLIVSAFFGFIYALVLAMLQSKRPIAMSHYILINVIVSILLLFGYYFFYFHEVDWLAVNDGLKQLSSWEAFIHSDILYYLSYLVGIVLYAILVRK